MGDRFHRLPRIALGSTGAGWLAAGLRRWRSPVERARYRVLEEDYRVSREQLHDITLGMSPEATGRIAWMVSSFHTVWGFKMEGALSLALRLRGYRPKAVHLTSAWWARKYHRLFGLSESIDLPASLGGARGRRAGDALAAEFLRRPRGIAELLALEFQGVAVGRIALSNVLNQRKFTRIDLADRQTAVSISETLGRSARSVCAVEDLLRRERPAVALLLEKGVSPMAELFGVCVREGVPVIQYAGAQKIDLYALKRYSMANRSDHPLSLDAGSWDRAQAIPWSGETDRALMQELEQGYRRATWFNRKFLHDGKRIKSAEEVREQLHLDPRKKTAVIFSHVLWDATFFYGVGLFDDYETWLLETVKAACANPRLNWVIKIHPDLVWKLKCEGFAGELRDVIALRSAVGRLPDHVTIVLPDTDIDTFSFFEITDYCLTVRGTIGIEMACHGVPVLTAGTGRYAGLGFTIDSQSKPEYLARLKALEALPPLTQTQVELARRYAHAVFRCRPWEMRSFRTVKAPLNQTGHPLDANLIPHVRTFADCAAAGDLQAFAAWVDSDDVDFLCLDAAADRECAAS
ncbi:MAG TPA: hypothetical protein VJM31_14460 [Vicinamibacterales bacterium]|nr:hypothetical protein [Vicinamibacterales bacterium]